MPSETGLIKCHRKLIRFSLLVAGLASILTTSPAPARPAAKIRHASYASVDECIITRQLEEAKCRTGFANARAEFEEKAPRFASRQACESSFAQCSVFLPPAGTALAKSGSGPEYFPLMDRIEIVPGKGGISMALPATRSRRLSVSFSPRPLDQPDTEISAKRGEAARQAWQASLARSNRPPPGSYPGTQTAGPDNFNDPEASKATGQPASYPVSPKRWNQIQSQVERIKRTGKPASGN